MFRRRNRGLPYEKPISSPMSIGSLFDALQPGLSTAVYTPARSNHLVQGILDDPDGAPLQQSGDELPDHLFRDHHFDGKPITLEEVRNRGTRDAGQDFDHTLKIVGRDIHLQP